MAYSSVLQEFLIRFGFRMDQMSANATLQSLGSLGGKLNMVARVGLTAFGALSREVFQTSMEMANLQLSADRLGMSVGALDNLMMAAKAAGGTESDVLKTLQTLQLKVGESALRIGNGANIFRKFGINVFQTNKQLKSMDTLLAEIALRFRSIAGDKMIDPRVRNALARQFGISEDFARVLAGDFGEMIVLTHKMGEAFEYNMDKMGRGAERFKKEFSKTALLIRIVRRSFVGDNINWFADRLFRLNKAIVEQAKGISFYKSAFSGFTKFTFSFLDAAGVVVIRLLSYLGRLMGFLGPLGKILGGFATGVAVLGTVLFPFTSMLKIALIPLLGKIVGIIMAVYAAFLLVDDVLSWIHGDESYLENLYNTLWDIAALIPRMIMDFDKWKQSIKEVGVLRTIFETALKPVTEDFTKLWGEDNFEDAVKKAQEVTGNWIEENVNPKLNSVNFRDPRDYTSEGNILNPLINLFKDWFNHKGEKPNMGSNMDKWIKDTTKEYWDKLINIVSSNFSKLLDLFSIRKIAEAIKGMFWMNSEGGNIRTGADSVQEEHGVVGKVKQVIKDSMDYLNSDREKNAKSRIDATYGRPDSGVPYSEHYGEWYRNRKGKPQQFGMEPKNEDAVKEDKYFANMADADDAWKESHLLNEDEIPQSAGMVDIHKPITKDKDQSVTPDTSKNSSFNFLGPSPELSLDPSVFQAASNNNQNVVVNTTVNVSGTSNPQEVANRVIEEQYTVATSTAGIVRPYLNEAAYG